jgi:hypothetical protein
MYFNYARDQRKHFMCKEVEISEITPLASFATARFIRHRSPTNATAATASLR